MAKISIFLGVFTIKKIKIFMKYKGQCLFFYHNNLLSVHHCNIYFNKTPLKISQKGCTFFQIENS